MTPLERATAAVEAALGPDDTICATPKDLARAVLEAIREPFQAFDDPVAIAGGEVLGGGKDRPLHWSNYDEAKRVWQAMIDAALSEGG